MNLLRGALGLLFLVSACNNSSGGRANPPVRRPQPATRGGVVNAPPPGQGVASPTNRPPVETEVVATGTLPDTGVEPGPEDLPPEEVGEPGPPRLAVNTGGMRIEVLRGGAVSVRTTDLWGGQVSATYESCRFYRAAIPPLRRSITPARGELLDRVCAPRPASP